MENKRRNRKSARPPSRQSPVLPVANGSVSATSKLCSKPLSDYPLMDILQISREELDSLDPDFKPQGVAKRLQGVIEVVKVVELQQSNSKSAKDAHTSISLDDLDSHSFSRSLYKAKANWDKVKVEAESSWQDINPFHSFCESAEESAVTLENLTSPYVEMEDGDDVQFIGEVKKHWKINRRITPVRENTSNALTLDRISPVRENQSDIFMQNRISPALENQSDIFMQNRISPVRENQSDILTQNRISPVRENQSDIFMQNRISPVRENQSDIFMQNRISPVREQSDILMQNRISPVRENQSDIFMQNRISPVRENQSEIFMQNRISRSPALENQSDIFMQNRISPVRENQSDILMQDRILPVRDKRNILLQRKSPVHENHWNTSCHIPISPTRRNQSNPSIFLNLMLPFDLPPEESLIKSFPYH